MFEQPEKAYCPMVLVPSPMCTEVMFEQSEKAYWPISFTASGIIILSNFWQLLKA
jgi:hypothetical protein